MNNLNTLNKDDVGDIVDVVKKWLDDKKISVVNIEHKGVVR